MSVVEVRHPLVQHKLSYLRDKDTPTVHFRRLVEEVCRYGQVVIATTSAAELGAVDLPAAQRLVHVAPADNADIPTSTVTIEDARGAGAP